MWKLSEKPMTILVTRQIATEWAEMQAVPNERPLSKRRIEVYQRALEEGSFRPVVWAKCLCKQDRVTYRVNGHHTSAMLTGLGKIPPFYATIESYTADDLDDIVKLHATFDSQMQNRTSSDIYRTFAGTIPELRELPQRHVCSIVGGLAYAQWADSYYAHSPAERAELLLDQARFATWFHKLVTTPEHIGLLCRVPVAGAMFATYEKSQKDAAAFWTAVRDASGPTPELPDRQLSAWLSRFSVAKGKGAMAGARRAPTREFYARSIHAWNAWRRKTSQRIVFRVDSEIPVAA